MRNASVYKRQERILSGLLVVHYVGRNVDDLDNLFDHALEHETYYSDLNILLVLLVLTAPMKYSLRELILLELHQILQAEYNSFSMVGWLVFIRLIFEC